MIDNYDSFTYNVYQYLCQLGADVTVHRNDQIDLNSCRDFNPTHVVISPGPGHPTKDSGVSIDVIREFAGKVPVLGVCLGHQAIFEMYGGTVDVAGEIMHGKCSPVHHDEKGCFKGVTQDVSVVRYHSLVGLPDTLPAELEVTARTDNGHIMGVRHKQHCLEGLQFHPESFKTDEGLTMLGNFLAYSGGTWDGILA